MGHKSRKLETRLAQWQPFVASDNDGQATTTLYGAYNLATNVAHILQERRVIEARPKPPLIVSPKVYKDISRAMQWALKADRKEGE